jgi:hypothetical protein
MAAIRHEARGAAREPDGGTPGRPMSVFERYLTLWVFLCIVAGIALGQCLPGPFQAIGRMESPRSTCRSAC